MTVMVAERIGTSASRNPYTARGKRYREVPSFCSIGTILPPRPAHNSAVARSGGQGWPVFGPPLQRRAASLTAASTAARSVAWGNRSTPIQPSKSTRARPSKTEITLTDNRGHLTPRATSGTMPRWRASSPRSRPNEQRAKCQIERFHNPKRRHSPIAYMNPMEVGRRAGSA